MSLLHWWPLNGDTKNKMEDSWLAQGGAFSDNGKIGRYCLHSLSSVSTPITIGELDPLNKSFAFSCWIKVNYNEVKAQIDTLNSTYDTPTGSIIGYNEYGGIAISWVANSKSNFENITVFGSIRGSHAPNGVGYYTLSFDTWTHLTLVNDAKNKRLEFYVDGNFIARATTSQFTSIGNSDYLVQINRPSIYGGNGPKTILPCYLNDVRIYDHCLTEEEVKLLAQGLVAHYPLKAPFLPNLLQGAEQYTKETPLIRDAYAYQHGSKQDSYKYHTNVTANIKRPGRYIFVLNTDGIPRDHAFDASNTAENRKYMICLRHKTNGAHPVWKEFQIAKDGRHYGFLDIEDAGDYDLRTNLYLYNNIGSNYTVKMWNMQLFECDEYIPEIFEPATLSKKPKGVRQRLGLDSCFEQDASGYGNHAVQSGDIEVAKSSTKYFSSAYFEGDSYIKCGQTTKVNDSITVSCWGYMDDWSGYAGKRLLSCTESGGWNFESRGDSADGEFCFALAINKAQGSIPYTYHNAYDQQKLEDEITIRKVKDLSAGWHFFCGTFDGFTTKLYIDGAIAGEAGTLDKKYNIYYNNNNGMFIGAEAVGSIDTPQENTLFSGLISDVRIYSTALSENDIEDLYGEVSFTSLNIRGAREFIETNHQPADRVSRSFWRGNFSEIDAPLSNMKVKALPDGSTWARIHNLDLTEQSSVFRNSEEVDDCDVFGKYSKMGLVDEFNKNSLNNYEFMLTYPSLKKGLPSEYTELEYIQSTGTQWINTGVTTNARWEFDIQFPDKEYPLIPQLTQNDNHIILEESRKTNGSFRIKEDQRWRAYMAFDKNHNTGGDVCYGHGYGIGVQLGYDFTSPHYVSSILLDAYVDSSQSIIQAQIWGKIQGDWWNLVTLTPENFTNHVERSYEINRDGITAIKLVTIDTSNGLGIIIREMQAYGHKRQLMGYGGNAGEYWGVQQDRRYGVYTDTTLNVFAGHRDTIVHDCLESGFRLWVKDAEVTLGTQDIAGRQYQLLTIDSNLGYTCNARLYRCNCIENGRLIRQFIPARRNSDKVIGLYDLAEGIFYTNNSPEPYPFIAGPEIEIYQQIEYLESTGPQYIDTGFTVETANFGDIFEVEAIASSAGLRLNRRDFLFGFSDPNYNHYAEFSSQIGGFKYGCVANYIDGVTIEANRKYHVKMRISAVDATHTIDGVSQTTTKGSNRTWGTFNIFRLNQDYVGTNIRIHWLKMTYNGKVIREFVPVMDKNGKTGMLDIINNKFYTNTGTGTFVKEEPTQLKYIESTGTQYIDTEVKPSTTLETEISFIPTDGLTEHAIFGSSWAADGYFLMFYHNQIRWHSGGNSVDIGSYKAGDRVVCHCTNKCIIVNGNGYTIDGGTNSTNNITILSDMKSHSGYQGGNNGIGKIEYVKMWENGVLIRDFIPVQKNDGTVCLYDRQNKQYYVNSGTGAFGAGPVINALKNPNITQYNRWIQTNSPNVNYRQSTGYMPIHTDFTRWNGSKYDVGPITESFDQERSIYLINNSNDPWGPIGQKELYGTGIRAANQTTQQQVELWVRIDKMPKADEIKQREGCYIAPQFIEY